MNVASANGARRVRSLTMRRPDVPWGAAGDKESRPRTRVGCNHRTGGPRENPTERSVGETWGRRVRNRRPRGRSKSSVSPVDGRRLGPGKATSCHDGGVEAVLAALAESVNRNAHRERGAHRYRVRVATEVSEVRSRRRVGGRQRPHEACAIRQSDAERREALSSSVSVGGPPSSTRPMKNR